MSRSRGGAAAPRPLPAARHLSHALAVRPRGTHARACRSLGRACAPRGEELPPPLRVCKLWPKSRPPPEGSDSQRRLRASSSAPGQTPGVRPCAPTHWRSLPLALAACARTREAHVTPERPVGPFRTPHPPLIAAPSRPLSPRPPARTSASKRAMPPPQSAGRRSAPVGTGATDTRADEAVCWRSSLPQLCLSEEALATRTRRAAHAHTHQPALVRARLVR